MYGREPRLPIDIVYGTQRQSSSSENFVQKSQKLMEEAYHRVRKNLSTGHQRQKDIYNKRVHGEPYAVGDTVWLLDTVIQKGQSKKFHHPWKGPYRVLKHTSDCDYLIEQASGDHTQMIVHFNCLKPCKPGTRFQVNSDGESHVNADPPTSVQVQNGSNIVGENLELVETNDKTTAVLPARLRRPPSRFADFISH